MDREADFLAELNDQQRRAVEHDAGPLAVLAGPGTGKTRVITSRVAHMVLSRGIAPEQIVAVTYTVKAANELRERLVKLIGPAAAERVNAFTFHGLGFRLIRRFSDMLGLPSLVLSDDGARMLRAGLIDSAQQQRLLRTILREQLEPVAGPGGAKGTRRLFDWCQPEGERSVIDRLKRYFAYFGDFAILPPNVEAFVRRAEAALGTGATAAGAALDEAGMLAERTRIDMLRDAGRAYEHYRRECRHRGLLSFSDLILLPITLLRDSPRAAAIVRDEWRHFVVDEFQDVNAAMIEFLRQLAPPSPRTDLCVVGDDDQAIYQFRGADDQAFRRFSATWPASTRVDLSESYRSDHRILRVANSVMSRAEARFAPEKEIRPPKTGGASSAGPAVEVVHLADEGDDGPIIAHAIKQARMKDPSRPLTSFAVIVRLNSSAAQIHDALRLEGIPAAIRASANPMEDEAVKDVLAWAQVVANPDSTWSAFRLLIRPPFAIPIEQAAELRRLYGLSRSKDAAMGTPASGSFVAWLAAQTERPEGVRRFLELHNEFSALNARQSVSRTLAAIVSRTDPAHAEPLSDTDRVERVKNLITLLRFVTDREDRFEPPRDLASWLSYMADLDDREGLSSTIRMQDAIDGRTDDDEETTDAVSITTAHSAKGLEFETVFVPRVSPMRGYPQVRSNDDGIELPAGFVEEPAALDAKQRLLSEERRIFYVACTRAKERLVLLARKTKGKSTSMHLLQELLGDASLDGSIKALEAADILAPGASASGATAEETRLDAAIGAASGPGAARQAFFREARREARAMAESALAESASGPDAASARASADRAGVAAARLAIIAHVERANTAPAWAAKISSEAAEFATDLERRLAALAESEPPRPSRLPGLKAPLRLSYSDVRLYDQCPRCFYVEKVLRLSPPAASVQIVGTVVHGALEKFFTEQRRADAGERAAPTLADLESFARRSFFESGELTGSAERAQLDQVLAQLRLTHERLYSPDAHILEIERNLELPVGEHVITTRIDRIDQISLDDGRTGFAVIDYKTGAAAKKLLEPDKDDLQLGVYTLALAHDQGIPAEELVGHAEYWVLAEGVRGIISFDKLRLKKIRSQIQQVIDGILAGIYSRGSECRGNCNILGPGDDLP